MVFVGGPFVTQVCLLAEVAQIDMGKEGKNVASALYHVEDKKVLSLLTFLLNQFSISFNNEY